MSLVARLSTSPRWRLSKYDSGSRDSFVWTSSRIRYMVRLTDRFTSRVATAISTPAATNAAVASSSTLPTAPKSMPLPGVKSVPLSMSATAPWPRWCIEASTCSLVIPAGICRPTIPPNTRSVALPRIFGPITLRVTLTTTHSSSRPIETRSGLKWPSSRLLEFLKSIERLLSGLPPAIIRPMGPAIRRPPLP